MAFVTIGFEHSVANMFFIPLGIFLASDSAVAAKLTAANLSFANVSWYNFFVTNLIPVTLGNIVGGAIFVSLIYWWVYLRSPLVSVKPAEPAKAAQAK